jgi:hypothetical protein
MFIQKENASVHAKNTGFTTNSLFQAIDAKSSAAEV